MEIAMSRLVLAACLAVLPLVGLASTSAEARIVCKDGSQLVAGSWLATPYCQDELVAKVAQTPPAVIQRITRMLTDKK